MQEGASYEGEFRNDQITGRGIMIWAQSKYEGTFIDGMKDGQGEMKYADGSMYAGNWDKDLRHGIGKMTWNTQEGPAQYDGEWQQDLKHGHGRYEWSEGGAFYEGNWA